MNLFAIFTFFLCLSGTVHAQSWEAQAVGVLPVDYGVFDISVVDENVVWAVAFDRTVGNDIPANHLIKVLKTTDGGSSWTSFDIEEAPGRISFDIEAMDENVALITTQDYGSGAGSGVLKTEDGGATWSNNFDSIAGGVWIRFFNSQEGLVINRQLMATTQDGGDSWQLVSSTAIPSFAEDEFTIIANGNTSCQILGDHVWFSTSKGRVFRSKDKGQTWEAFSTSLGGNAIVYSVAFSDTLNGLAIANLNPLATSFSRTSDGGETWENLIPSTSVSIVGLVAVPNTANAFVGTAGSSTLSTNWKSVYSNDFGQSWETINTGIPFAGLEFVDANIGWTSREQIGSSGQAALFKWEGDIFVNATEVSNEESFDVYPNPFKAEINLKGPADIQAYRLYASDGQLIESGRIHSNQFLLDFASLKMGVYILELTADDGHVIIKQIVKAQ